MAELRAVMAPETTNVAKHAQRRPTKRSHPVRRQPVDDLKEIIAPDYRKILTFVIAAVVICAALVSFNLFAANYVETHARATFAVEIMKAAADHKQYETTLSDHSARLIKLEATSVQTNENLIKVNSKLDNLITAIQEIKDQRKR